jgi:hypothetical protein
MKRPIFFLLLVLACSLLLAQIGYIRDVEIQSPSVGFYIMSTTPKAIFSCADGGTIIINEVKVSNQEDIWVGDICVVKVDQMGNSVWQRFVNHWSWYDLPNATGIDIDANGTVHFMSDDFGVIEVYTINQSGNIITECNLHITDLSYINRAKRLNNGEIACVGVGWGPVSWSEDYFKSAAYLRISETGDSLSFKLYPPDSLTIGNPEAKAFDMELDNDGLPIITCHFTSYKASVIKVDLAGNLIFRSDVEFNLGYLDQIPITKSPSNEYNLICICTFFDIEGLSYNIVYKVENNVLDSLFSFQEQTFSFINRILDTSAGFYMSGSINSRYFIGNLDLTGSVQWDSLFTGIINNYLDDQHPGILNYTFDNCIIGIFQYGGVQSGFTIVKLLPDGTITDNNDQIEAQEPFFLMDVFPNPVLRNTHFKVKNIQNNNKRRLIASIYNIRGQLVRKLELDRKDANLFEADWDRANENGVICASGVYIIRVEQPNINLSKKIIVIH